MAKKQQYHYVAIGWDDADDRWAISEVETTQESAINGLYDKTYNGDKPSQIKVLQIEGLTQAEEQKPEVFPVYLS